MRLGLVAAFALLACSACATGGGDSLPKTPRPPEGVGKGGTDFGRWRTDAEGSVDSAFRTFIYKKYGPQDAVKARADLETDGFVCKDKNRPDGAPVPDLACTREYFVNDEIHAWTVSFWPDRQEPEAHYSRIFRRDPLRNYDSEKHK